MTPATSSAVIPASEFAGRRAAAAAMAKARGLDGLLVCSRGGGTTDRYANILYLTNFYTPFPFIPDRRPEWSARAHAFLILPTGAPPALVVDVPYLEGSEIQIDEVVVASDMVGAVAREVRARGLQDAALGVVGADTMPWGIFRQLQKELPGVRWSVADEILDDLRALKSPGEIALLAQASAIGSRAINAMLDAARPGATHAEVTLAGLQVLVPAGAILYNAFMSSGTGGERPTVVRHNFPTYGAAPPLAEGQWYRVGLSGVYRGYYFDLARSTAIGRATPQQVDAFEAAIACVQAALDAIRPGVTAGEVAAAGLRKVQGLGYPPGSAFSGVGHGLGLAWDSPWLVLEEGTVLKPGMVLCVERTVNRQGYVGDFEETALVTADGIKLLTTARIRRW